MRLKIQPAKASPVHFELTRQLRKTSEQSIKNFRKILTENHVPHDLLKSSDRLPPIGKMSPSKIGILDAIPKELKLMQAPHVQFNRDYRDVIDPKTQENEPARHYSQEYEYTHYEPVTLSTRQFRDAVDKVLQNVKDSEIQISHSKLYELRGRDMTLSFALNRLIHIPTDEVLPALTPLTAYPEGKLREERNIPDSMITKANLSSPNLITAS